MIIKNLNDLSQKELLEVVAIVHENTMYLLAMLNEARECNRILQMECARRVAEHKAIPDSVKAQLDEIAKAAGSH